MTKTSWRRQTMSTAAYERWLQFQRSRTWWPKRCSTQYELYIDHLEITKEQS